MTHASFTPQQTHFQGYADDAALNAATAKAAEDGNWTQGTDENFRVRFVVQETAGGGSNNESFTAFYSHEGGAFTRIDGASSVVRSTASPNVADGATITTSALSGSGSFLNGAFDEVDGLVGGAISFNGNDYTEVEFCFQVRGADVANGDSIVIRVHDSGESAFSTAYTSPTLTVEKANNVQVGLATEADSAFAIGRAKAITVGLAAETEAAFSVTASKGRSIDVGLATESEVAFAVSRAKSMPVGLATSTETAFALSAAKIIPVGLASGTESAFAVGHTRAVQVGLATETEMAFSVDPSLDNGGGGGGQGVGQNYYRMRRRGMAAVKVSRRKLLQRHR